MLKTTVLEFEAVAGIRTEVFCRGSPPPPQEVPRDLIWVQTRDAILGLSDHFPEPWHGLLILIPLLFPPLSVVFCEKKQ
jgi:hypothetical protein